MGENMGRLSPMKSTHSWLKTYINARTGRTTLRIACIKYPYECQYSRAIPCMTCGPAAVAEQKLELESLGFGPCSLYFHKLCR